LKRRLFLEICAGKAAAVTRARGEGIRTKRRLPRTKCVSGYDLSPGPASPRAARKDIGKVLTAGRRATKFLLCFCVSQHRSLIMDALSLALLVVLIVLPVHVAGRIAERRGRSFVTWAWIAAAIGPLALPLVYLFPNLHGKNGGRANGDQA
jgi:hypothetical protein